MKNLNAKSVLNELKALGSPEKAKHLSRFFKTGPGQYGEGDQFLGIRVPEQRRIAKQYSGLDLAEIEYLLSSVLHECRLTGLLILVHQYGKEKAPDQKNRIVKFYLSHLDRVNNWDLVDLSAPKILGHHFLENPSKRPLIFKLVESCVLWERRIAVLSTFTLLKSGEFEELLKLADQLQEDKEDLMHKAVGWMLREMGKIQIQPLEGFLEKHRKTMPRTMLRYAIERMSPEKRKYYMTK